jgi:hypothetical protein
LADPAQYLSSWIIFGLWKLDFDDGIGNWEIFGGIGGILGNWEIFGFSNFHRSNLLDKRLAIGRTLGNWEGLSVNWKIQNSNPIGNWNLEN